MAANLVVVDNNPAVVFSVAGVVFDGDSVVTVVIVAVVQKESSESEWSTVNVDGVGRTVDY